MATTSDCGKVGELREAVRCLVEVNPEVELDGETHLLSEAQRFFGWCTSASEKAESWLRERGIVVRPADISTGISFASVHYATVVGTDEGDYVVDLTVRQFYPDLPYPYLVPRETYCRETGFSLSVPGDDC